MSKPKFPTFSELVWATLDVLKDARRPMSMSEIVLLVAEKLSLCPEVIDLRHNTVTELQYRIGWVLTKLKNIGAVESVKRGYWSITRAGRDLYEKLKKDRCGRC